MSGSWIRLLRAGAGSVALAVADRRSAAGDRGRTRESIVKTSLARVLGLALGAAVDAATLGDIAAETQATRDSASRVSAPKP